jgi:hypothetical protein
MHAERQTIAVVTDEAGAAVVYSDYVTGRIAAIVYSKDDFADGVDFAITLEKTGQSLWTDTNVNASETVYPLAAGNLGGTGAVSTLTEVPIIAANDRVKIVISQGGEEKSGLFHLVIA